MHLRTCFESYCDTYVANECELGTSILKSILTSMRPRSICAGSHLYSTLALRLLLIKHRVRRKFEFNDYARSICLPMPEEKLTFGERYGRRRRRREESRRRRRKESSRRRRRRRVGRGRPPGGSGNLRRGHIYAYGSSKDKKKDALLWEQILVIFV